MNLQNSQQQNFKSKLSKSTWRQELIALEQDQEEKRKFFKGEWIDELITFAKVLN